MELKEKEAYMYDDDDYDFEIESYNDDIENYNDELMSLEDEEIMLKDKYESQIKEIDEYWDKENQYIQDSGIYTKEEVQQILANHDEIRRSKKAEVEEKYNTELRLLNDERDIIQSDKEAAEFDRDLMIDEMEYEHIIRDDDTSSNDEAYYALLRAKREEQAAYDDFIASLDMND